MAIDFRRTLSLGQALLRQGAAPSTPAAGLTALYAKSDGRIYQKTPDGVELEVVAGRVVFHLTRGSQGITTGGGGSTAITWGTVIEDPYSFASANPVLTIPTGYAGTYVITARAAAPVAGRSFIEITPTSTVTGAPAQWRVPMDPAEDQAIITIVTRFADGDTFSFGAFHSTGSTQNFAAWIYGARLGP